MANKVINDISIAAAISGFDPDMGPRLESELQDRLRALLSFVAQHCQRVPGGEMVVTYTPEEG